MVLVCMLLITNNIEYLLMLTGPLNSLHCEILVEIFCPFAMGCLSFSYWLTGVLYVFQM